MSEMFSYTPTNGSYVATAPTIQAQARSTTAFKDLQNMLTMGGQAYAQSQQEAQLQAQEEEKQRIKETTVGIKQTISNLEAQYYTGMDEAGGNLDTEAAVRAATLKKLVDLRAGTPPELLDLVEERINSTITKLTKEDSKRQKKAREALIKEEQKQTALQNKQMALDGFTSYKMSAEKQIVGETNPEVKQELIADYVNNMAVLKNSWPTQEGKEAIASKVNSELEKYSKQLGELSAEQRRKKAESSIAVNTSTLFVGDVKKNYADIQAIGKAVGMTNQEIGELVANLAVNTMISNATVLTNRNADNPVSSEDFQEVNNFIAQMEQLKQVDPRLARDGKKWSVGYKKLVDIKKGLESLVTDRIKNAIDAQDPTAFSESVQLLVDNKLIDEAQVTQFSIDYHKESMNPKRVQARAVATLKQQGFLVNIDSLPANMQSAAKQALETTLAEQYDNENYSFLKQQYNLNPKVIHSFMKTRLSLLQKGVENLAIAQQKAKTDEDKAKFQQQMQQVVKELNFVKDLGRRNWNSSDLMTLSILEVATSSDIPNIEQALNVWGDTGSDTSLISMKTVAAQKLSNKLSPAQLPEAKRYLTALQYLGVIRNPDEGVDQVIELFKPVEVDGWNGVKATPDVLEKIGLGEKALEQFLDNLEFSPVLDNDQLDALDEILSRENVTMSVRGNYVEVTDEEGSYLALPVSQVQEVAALNADVDPARGMQKVLINVGDSLSKGLAADFENLEKTMSVVSTSPAVTFYDNGRVIDSMYKAGSIVNDMIHDAAFSDMTFEQAFDKNWTRLEELYKKTSDRSDVALLKSGTEVAQNLQESKEGLKKLLGSALNIPAGAASFVIQPWLDLATETGKTVGKALLNFIAPEAEASTEGMKMSSIWGKYYQTKNDPAKMTDFDNDVIRYAGKNLEFLDTATKVAEEAFAMDLHKAGFSTGEMGLLLYHTALHESEGFQYNVQLKSGPARSYLQVEPKTAYDNIHEGKIHLGKKFEDVTGLKWKDLATKTKQQLGELLLENEKFAISMALVKYIRAVKQEEDELKKKEEQKGK